jgi:hypothetical protein
LKAWKTDPDRKSLGLHRGQAGWEGKSYKLLNLPIRAYLDLLIK